MLYVSVQCPESNFTLITKRKSAAAWLTDTYSANFPLNLIPVHPTQRFQIPFRGRKRRCFPPRSVDPVLMLSMLMVTVTAEIAAHSSMQTIAIAVTAEARTTPVVVIFPTISRVATHQWQLLPFKLPLHPLPSLLENHSNLLSRNIA
jgi:hypothetical protein